MKLRAAASSSTFTVSLITWCIPMSFQLTFSLFAPVRRLVDRWEKKRKFKKFFIFYSFSQKGLGGGNSHAKTMMSRKAYEALKQTTSMCRLARMRRKTYEGRIKTMFEEVRTDESRQWDESPR